VDQGSLISDIVDGTAGLQASFESLLEVKEKEVERIKGTVQRDLRGVKSGINQ
jgi:hypothetical protein